MALDDSDVRPGGTGRIVYSSEGDLTPPPEPTSTCLGQWKQRPVNVDKYVDDNLQQEAVNTENCAVLPVLGEAHKSKHAVLTQNVFRHVVRNAAKKGMKVNSEKTSMVCISDSQNYKISSYIYDAEGVRIDSTSTMKVLGWHFSSRPTPDAYLDTMIKRFRERYWTLRHLKHNGFTEKELVTVYTTIVRPVADYMMETYHSMMNDSYDEAVERLQTHALKCIFGPRLSARRLRELAGVSTLRQRRIEHCDKFARKCADSPRFSHWFPPVSGRRSGRNGDEYKEEYARCKRLYNSPLFYMRRRLNGKPGKQYGERNRQYREDWART